MNEGDKIFLHYPRTQGGAKFVGRVKTITWDAIAGDTITAIEVETLATANDGTPNSAGISFILEVDNDIPDGGYIEQITRFNQKKGF